MSMEVEVDLKQWRKLMVEELVRMTMIKIEAFRNRNQVVKTVTLLTVRKFSITVSARRNLWVGMHLQWQNSKIHPLWEMTFLIEVEGDGEEPNDWDIDDFFDWNLMTEIMVSPLT